MEAKRKAEEEANCKAHNEVGLPPHANDAELAKCQAEDESKGKAGEEAKCKVEEAKRKQACTDTASFGKCNINNVCRKSKHDHCCPDHLCLDLAPVAAAVSDLVVRRGTAKSCRSRGGGEGKIGHGIIGQAQSCGRNEAHGIRGQSTRQRRAGGVSAGPCDRTEHL